jgi:hypothetical protein
MRFFVIAFLLALPCSADEMLLRDGKRLAWKSLSDDGDNYSIQTKDGRTVSVRKADVERLSVPSEDPAAPAAGPLTGASISFPTKQTATTDLLLKADVQKAEGWKLVGRTLVGTASWPTRAPLMFDYGPLPEEYDLTLIVERGDSGNKDFDVGIVVPGGLCAFHFDCYDGTKSCLALVGGGEGEHANGCVFKSGKPRTVKLMVRREALIVQLDGKDFSKNHVDWKQASLHPAVKVSISGRLFVVAAGGAWKVSSFSITSVK